MSGHPHTDTASRVALLPDRPHDDLMTRLAALVVGLALILTGCGLVGSGDAASGKCIWRIKSAEVVFDSYGETQHAAQEYGHALQAACDDTGSNARGSVFTDESLTVMTYTFSGYPPSRVLGVAFGDGPQDGLGVFMSDAVSPEDREQILRELGPLKR